MDTAIKPERRIEYLITKGDMASLEGNTKGAIDDYGQAAELAKKHGLRALEGEALRKMGNLESRTGDFVAAGTHLKRGLDLAKEEGDEGGEADALRLLGFVHMRRNEFFLAEEYFQRYMEYANASKDPAIIGLANVEIGNIYLNMERMDVARTAYTKALKLLEPLGPSFELMRAFNNIAEVEKRECKPRNAIDFLRRAVDVCREMNNPTAMAWPLFNLAENLVLVDKGEEALEAVSEAIPILMNCDDNVGLSNALRARAVVYRYMKDYDAAEADLKESLRLSVTLKRERTAAHAHLEWARLEAQRGNREAAISHLKDALAYYENLEPDYIKKGADILLKELESGKPGADRTQEKAKAKGEDKGPQAMRQPEAGKPRDGKEKPRPRWDP